ncbi:MAG: MerR family transcriptional regulator [Clostridia bacterium]|nr:MerR family transcriptional regulator [Clostridia bacterium]
MYQKPLYDITEVCRMLGTTSRSLRFYEEKGIIQSTTIGTSSRRQYTEDQLSLVKNVLVLRTLGLSVKAIAELQNSGTGLKDAVLSKRAEIYASIESRVREINLLNEALSALESGKNIFSENWQHSFDLNAEENEIARLCTDAILNGDDNILYEHLSPRLTQYMPKDVYRVVRKDTLEPLGDFVSIDKTVADDRLSNKLYCFVRYSKLGLKVTYVFHGGKIDGLWLGYYDTNSR